MLKAENITFAYTRSEKLFSNISFSLEKGGMLHILGPNGCGKTTLARCLLGLLKCSNGNITINDREISSFPPAERAREIGYIGLGESSVLQLETLEYVVLGCHSTLRGMENPSEYHYNAAMRVMEKVGISHLANKKVSCLSQGEHQLASIARILLQEPGIVIFDEPTAALDMKNKHVVLDMMKQLNADGLSVINITHDPNHAVLLGGTALLLGNGRSIFGKTEDVMTEENLSELYDTAVHVFKLPHGEEFVTSLY